MVAAPFVSELDNVSNGHFKSNFLPTIDDDLNYLPFIFIFYQ